MVAEDLFARVLGDGWHVAARFSGQAFFAGLAVVAEGVETEEQLALLRAMRCKLVQGFLVGRPAPAARAREQLWSAADPLRPAGQAAVG